MIGSTTTSPGKLTRGHRLNPCDTLYLTLARPTVETRMIWRRKLTRELERTIHMSEDPIKPVIMDILNPFLQSYLIYLLYLEIREIMFSRLSIVASSLQTYISKQCVRRNRKKQAFRIIETLESLTDFAREIAENKATYNSRASLH